MTKMILLVEDNPDDEKLTLRAFKNGNVANPIEVVRDGVEALDFLFARGAYSHRADMPLPTLVVLDLKLPKLDGLDVLKAIRADPRSKIIPVVILTSSNEDHDIRSCYELGANSYVRKPVDFVKFLETSMMLGLYWLMVNQPCPEHTSS